MSRLFITPREIALIQDIGAEIIKDIVGQKIYYYSINTTKTNIDEIYNEAPEKIFDNPIELDCLILYNPEEVRTNQFGTEEYKTVEVYVHPKDLINKDIELSEGDFFSFGTAFFEAVSVITDKITFGMVEYDNGIKIIGHIARKNQFVSKVLGPTSERFTDPDAVQKQFIQQRGFAENSEGETGDVRELQKTGVLEKTIANKPTEVSPKGTSGNTKSAFYDE